MRTQTHLVPRGSRCQFDAEFAAARKALAPRSPTTLTAELVPTLVQALHASTWANETGAARTDAIEACLAHHEKEEVRAAYNRAQFNEERRALLAAWLQYLNSSNVIESHRAA